jgi:hypothetical protein
MDGKPSSESAGVRTDEIGRRLGRIRLLPEPVLEHKPLSDLGFDPILSHPTFDEFKDLIGKKKGTIKGVIMDQAFSAGVGNVSISISDVVAVADNLVGGRRVSSKLIIFDFPA